MCNETKMKVLSMQLDSANRDLIEIRQMVGANEEETIQEAVKRLVEENKNLKACLFIS